jgi:phage tail sheath protein FI
MAQDYHHGARVQEVSDTIRSIRTLDTGIIGMVVTADDADADSFPLNEPTLITDIYAALGKAGSTGTFARSLDAIKDQTRPLAVVVRVPEGKSDAEQTANVIGGVTIDGRKTGIQALLGAQSKCGVRPRILGVPVLDNAAVTNELVTLAQATRAMVYAGTHCDTIEAAADYRKNFGQRELMLIHGDFTAFDVATQRTDDAYTVARALGLRAKIDAEESWSRSLSNVVVNGVTGIAQNLSWDLQDPNTDAGFLNSHEITTLIRRDGFRFWGSRTCATQNGDFMFETYTRTAQVLADTIAEAQFEEIDTKMLPVRVKHIIQSINAKLRAMTREGDLLGGECWFPEDLNAPEILKSGKLWISYRYTPVPPIENLMLRQTITDAYLVDFAAAVAAA